MKNLRAVLPPAIKQALSHPQSFTLRVLRDLSSDKILFDHGRSEECCNRLGR